MHEREGGDIKDVENACLATWHRYTPLREFPGKAIIIAEDPTPSDTAEPDADKVMDLQLTLGGKLTRLLLHAPGNTSVLALRILARGDKETLL